MDSKTFILLLLSEYPSPSPLSHPPRTRITNYHTIAPYTILA